MSMTGPVSLEVGSMSEVDASEIYKTSNPDSTRIASLRRTAGGAVGLHFARKDEA